MHNSKLDHYRFLIVDDSRLMRLAYKKILDQTKAELVFAVDGKECIEILEDNDKFDLAILDFTLPDLNGIDLLRHIRETQSLTTLPIIMLTTKDDIEILSSSFSYGANDYLRKPFNEQELLHRIRIQLKMKELVEESNLNERLQMANAVIASYNHEINNPLSIALNSAKRIKVPEGDVASEKKKEMLLTSIIRINDLIQKISQATNLQLTNYDEKNKMLDLEKED